MVNNCDKGIKYFLKYHYKTMTILRLFKMKTE